MAVEPFRSMRPPRGGAAAVQAVSVAARGGLGAAVDVDLLLADLVADLLLLGHRLLVQPDALYRDGLLGDDGALLGEGHLVLLLGDVRAGQSGVPVALGDRLALDPDLLAGHRNGDRLLLGGHVLAEPGAAGLHLLGADVEPLLRPGHRLVRRGARGVVPDGRTVTVDAAHDVAVAVSVDAEVRRATRRLVEAGGTGGRVRRGARGGVAGSASGAVVGAAGGRGAFAQAVVAVQLGLLRHLEVAVRGHPGRVLDLALGVGHVDAVGAVEAGVLQGHKRLGGAEQARVHRDPARGTRRVVEVDLAGLADLVAGVVVHGRALDVIDLVLADHACSFVVAGAPRSAGPTRLS